jgi:hypothetical protein
MVAPLRALLPGLIDYAGLFAPAELGMADAVAEYARHRSGPDAWVLGRFVVPAARLDEFAAAQGAVAGTDPWLVSALVGADRKEDIRRIESWSATERFRIDALETKAGTIAELDSARSELGQGRECYVEIPIIEDPAPLLSHLVRLGVRAKVRTGGVTQGLFPLAADLVRFLERCHQLRLAFKATAGLHHPLAGEYRLTYAPGSPRGRMFGFLTLFAAAAAVREGWPADQIVAVLQEDSRQAFRFDGAGLHWDGRVLSPEALGALRATSAIAFGSCSFAEPLTDLRALGYLPA